ncbi:MAG: hypothetical protein NZ770_07320, partial [Candidatus Poseidoniaceae archaeon]|nr:hypothetical protein [Candidatus Poseidoniaceae archaeon]
MGYALEPAIKGVGSEMADDFEEELGEEIENPFGLSEGGNDEDEMFVCSDGTSIYEWEVNNGWEDCPDGLDEGIIIPYEHVNVVLNYEDEADYVSFSLQFDGLERAAQEDGEELRFFCDDGDDIPFSWVNDGSEECDDGSDEYDWATDNQFTCSNGEQTPLNSVNDGELDCDDGGDEGITVFYTINVDMKDQDGNLITSGSTNLCDYHSTGSCDNYVWRGHGSVYYYHTDEDIPGNEFCVDWELYGADNYLLAAGEECGIGGPRVAGVNVWDDTGMSVSFDVWTDDTWDTEGYSLRAKILDSSGATIYSEQEEIEGYGSMYTQDVEVGAEGTFCVEATLLDAGGNVVSTMTDCTEVEDEPRPSEKLEKIGEALGNSNLENTIESFFENLGDKFSDIEANEFPYSSGKFYSFWSDTHATIVG